MTAAVRHALSGAPSRRTAAPRTAIVRSCAASCLCLLAVSLVLAQDALAPLQGRWVVSRAEALGEPLDAIKGGVLTVTGSDFVIRTAAGTLLTGTLRADGTKRPAHLDLVHADGEVWEAIYSIESGTLRLIYVPADSGEARPSTFDTSAASNRTLVVLDRSER